MAWLPKSRKARRRLAIVAAAGIVLAVAAGLVFYALGDSVSLFMTPTQAAKAHPKLGRTIELGGLVQAGSVAHHPDGSVEFVVTDTVASDKVIYKGELPDLFREGQGVVTKGSFKPGGVFEAVQVLAKHDETYMPRELEKALKENGEWRGQGAPPPRYQPSAASPANYGKESPKP